MRSWMIATAVLFVATAAFALPDAEAQVGTSSLAGTICAMEDEYYAYPQSDPTYVPCPAGVPNATVRLTRPGPLNNSVAGVDQSTTTDARGAYSFRNIPDGTDYTLSITRASFEATTKAVKVQGETRLDVALKGKVIDQSGRVVGENGRAVADARVSVCCAYREGFESLESQEDRTDADGRFTLKTVAGFRYLYVGDASGYEDANLNRLLEGTPITITLRPLPPPDAFIRGTIRDQDGNPVAGARIDAYSHGPPCCDGQTEPGSPGEAKPTIEPYPIPYRGGSNRTTTAADGSYRIGVYAGSVSLSAQRDGYTYRHAMLEVSVGETATKDLRMLKFPEKTAQLVGRVTDSTGKGLQAVSVSVRSPEYGLYECSTNGLQPDYGGPRPLVAEDKAERVATSMYYPQPDCAITIDSEGNLRGFVTPGYAIVDVHFQSWLACPSGKDCGPEYYSFTRTLVLKDGENRLDVQLRQRPGPDAVVSGYVVDVETGKAIAGAALWFWNHDNGSGGNAQTDADGSFRVRVRSGHHQVSVSVYDEKGQGQYLSWQGVADFAAGENPFDVMLTPGEESGGGCCYAYADKGVATTEATPASMGADRAAAGGPSAPEAAPNQASDFEDLGGGLGPYDAQARQKLSGTETSPSAGIALAIALLGLAAVLRRRA
jgi:uncharacterized protein (TIGR03382 family)